MHLKELNEDGGINMETRYKNGSIHIKIDSYKLEELVRMKADFKALFTQLQEQMTNVDCYVEGDPFCMCNVCMAVDFHCAYNGLYYRVTDSDVIRFGENKTLILNGFKK